MKYKKRYLAVAVTTEEALEACFSELSLLFCIENPLYNRVRYSIRNRKDAEDYDIAEWEEKEVMMLKRNRGSVRFDDTYYIPFYLPLLWDGWKS